MSVVLSGDKRKPHIHILIKQTQTHCTLVLEGRAHLTVDAPVRNDQSQVRHQASHQLHALHLLMENN